MKHEENNSKKEKRGLYISLALCLVAIALAAWGTYDSLTNYIDEETNDVGTVVQSPEPTITPKTSEKPTATPTPTEKPAEPSPEPSQVESEVSQTEQSVEEIANTEVYNLAETFISPIKNGEVIKEYSGYTLVYNETMRDYRVHNGLDISAETGETVYATNSGIVKEIYKDLLLGNIVVIEHGDYLVSYCGLSDDILVAVGDAISQDLPIGSIGAIPSETESTHIHIEVKKDDKTINPQELIFG